MRACLCSRMCISPGGGRSWLLMVHVRGRRREMGLGSVRTYNLTEARERARKCRQLVHAGKDPIFERESERAANDADLASRRTFRECAAEYVRLHTPQWRNAKFRKDWPASLERYVYPTMGDTDLRLVGKVDVVRVLEPIWHEKTETATRVRCRIKMVLEWANGLRPPGWRPRIEPPPRASPASPPVSRSPTRCPVSAPACRSAGRPARR